MKRNQERPTSKHVQKELLVGVTSLSYDSSLLIKGHYLVIVKDQSYHLVHLKHMHNLQTCENLTSIGRRSCERIMEEKTPLLAQISCLNLRPQQRCQIHFKYFSDKLLCSQKHCYFRGNRFSQCVILSTVLHYSLPSKFLC